MPMYRSRGDTNLERKYPPAAIREAERLFECSHDRSVLIGALPSSMFSNSYSYGTQKLHERNNHTLYEVHWVREKGTLAARSGEERCAGWALDPLEPSNRETPCIAFSPFLSPSPLSNTPSFSLFRIPRCGEGAPRAPSRWP